MRPSASACASSWTPSAAAESRPRLQDDGPYPTMARMSTPFRALRFVTSTLLVLLLGLPVLALVGRVGGFEASTLDRAALGEALGLSLRTTALSIVLIVLCGTPLAWWLARGRSWWRVGVQTCLDLPLVLPPTVAGLALLLAFGRSGALGTWLAAHGVQLPFTTAAVVCAQVFVSAPLYVSAARAAFATIDPTLEEAAATLGSGDAGRFFRVSLPLARPGLLAGAVMATARALGEFGATLMFAGNLAGVTRTLPLAVYGALQVDPEQAIALSLVLLALAGLLLALLRLVGRPVAEVRDVAR